MGNGMGMYGKNIGFEVISWDLRPLNMGKNIAIEHGHRNSG